MNQTYGHQQFTKNVGGIFRLGDEVDVQVVGIAGEQVKLALIPLADQAANRLPPAAPGIVNCNGSGYYRSQPGSPCTFIVTIHSGKSLRINDQYELSLVAADRSRSTFVAAPVNFTPRTLGPDSAERELLRV